MVDLLSAWLGNDAVLFRHSPRMLFHIKVFLAKKW